MALPVRYTDDLMIEGLGFTVALDGALSEDSFKYLNELINAWYMVGFYGGFGGTGFHHLAEPEYDEEDLLVSWTVDMGDVMPEQAVEVLATILDGFSQPTHSGPSPTFKELIIGFIVEE